MKRVMVRKPRKTRRIKRKKRRRVKTRKVNINRIPTSLAMKKAATKPMKKMSSWRLRQDFMKIL